MKKTITLVGIGLIIGFGAGYIAFYPTAKSETMTMKEQDTTAQMAEKMSHPMLEVDSNNPVPTVDIEASRDSKDGYNLHIIATNYTFTPEKTGGAPVANEGHAHLYVNGTKIARLYGPWFNLSNSSLKDGTNVVQVTLNANDHSEWTVAKQHIAAEVIVTK